jgi:hypothetical protein
LFIQDAKNKGDTLGGNSHPKQQIVTGSQAGATLAPFLRREGTAISVMS